MSLRDAAVPELSENALTEFCDWNKAYRFFKEIQKLLSARRYKAKREI